MLQSVSEAPESVGTSRGKGRTYLEVAEESMCSPEIEQYACGQDKTLGHLMANAPLRSLIMRLKPGPL